MCRSIKPLFNFDPPASEQEIYEASLQYIRKVSGYTQPSRLNKEPFDQAVFEVAKATSILLETLSTNAAPKDREIEAAKARQRAENRGR